MMDDRDSQLLAGMKAVLAELTAGGQPDRMLGALDRAYQELVGHKLITFFRVDDRTGDVERIYSTDLPTHPVGPSSRKNMMGSEWGQAILVRREAFLADTMEDLRRIFPQHGALAALGCGSCLSYSAVYGGRCVGAVNLCHEEKHYTENRSRLGRWLAPLMLPAVLGP